MRSYTESSPACAINQLVSEFTYDLKLNGETINDPRSESGQAVRTANLGGCPWLTTYVLDVRRAQSSRRTTVWRWCKNGELPAFKVGRGWRIRKSDVDKMMTPQQE